MATAWGSLRIITPLICIFGVFAIFEITAEIVKLDCLPDYGIEAAEAADKCKARACEWSDQTSGRVSKCSYPPTLGYQLAGGEIRGESGSVNLDPTSAHAKRYTGPLNVKFEAVKEGPNRVQLKFTDREDPNRFEIPPEVIRLNPPSVTKGDAAYEVSLIGEENTPFALQVNRAGAPAGTAALLDTTGIPGFTYENQFVEMSCRLPSDYVYGFGEHDHNNFKHSFDHYWLPMFTRAHVVAGETDHKYPNLYGAHPFFMGLDSEGKAYGVLFWNSNAQEVVLQPNNILTYRTIGGVLDMRVMLGPSPSEVTQQYHEMIGKPYFPPYWSLGFQLSKYWYGNLQTMKNMYDRMKKAKIPWDVQHHDIDYMDRQRAFTIDPVDYKGIRKFVEDIQEKGMRSVVIFDPAMTNNETNWHDEKDPADKDYPAWIDGEKNNVFIRFPTEHGGDIAYGKVWPDFPSSTKETCHTPDMQWDEQVKQCRAFSAFPDYFKPATSDWWVDQSVKFHKGNTVAGEERFGEGIPFDGLWIDMNEPENFIPGSLNFKDKPFGCPETKWDNPPYLPHLADRDQGITIKTLCLATEVTVGDRSTEKKYSLYNMHSLYGHSMAVPTLKAADAATGKRSMVFSRSTFPGTGALIGHWLGDNRSSWDHLRRSIIGMLEFNIFGITYTGADVCGFFDHEGGQLKVVEEELCHRWTQLGAFYTFSRNHATKHKPEQDPANFGENFTKAARKVLTTRYTLLPYLYTLMYEANKNGGTVLRSLMEEFHDDSLTWTIDRQFLWGSGLLITPVLEKSANSVKGYLAKGRWYSWYDGKEETEATRGRERTFESTLEDYRGDIPLHVRGGHILPTQEPGITTSESRLNPMGMVIALDGDGKATGKLHWDEGESDITATDYQSLDVSMEVKSSKLTVTATATNDYKPELHWGKIVVFGAPSGIKSVNVQGQGNPFIQEGDKLTIDIGENLAITQTLNVEWSLPPPDRDAASPSAVPLTLITAFTLGLTVFSAITPA